MRSPYYQDGHVTLCASTFLGASCDRPACHAGTHASRHSSGYITVWDDAAADVRAVIGCRPRTTHPDKGSDGCPEGEK